MENRSNPHGTPLAQPLLMRTRNLRKILAGTMAATIGACGGISESSTTPRNTTNDAGTNSPADSSTSTDGGILDAFPDSGPFAAPFNCINVEDPYEALRLATSADYLEQRDEYGGAPARISVAVGTKCKTAADKNACEAALAAVTTTDYLFPGRQVQGGSYLVYTRADFVRDISNEQELLDWILPIDAPAKAWIRAAQSGFGVQCREPSWIKKTDYGYEILTERMIADCPVQYQSVLILVAPDGKVTELETKEQEPRAGCMGRRPEGLLASMAPDNRSVVGAHFAEAARLEAASIAAFEILRDELIFHNAPKRLIRAAERAAKDEVRHTHLVAGLARRYGAEVKPAVVSRPKAPRSIEEIARENAVEGCVRETFGALEGLWQARFAADPLVRDVMKGIAKDEIRHAELAWAVAEWAETKLSSKVVRSIRAARNREVKAVARAAAEPRNHELIAQIGVPDVKNAISLANELRARLWAA